MPTDANLLLLRRVAAALNAAMAVFQLVTSVLFGLAFTGFGALFLLVGLAENDPVPQIFGGAFGGFGLLLSVGLFVLLVIPHGLAAWALARRGGVWREIVAAVAVSAAWSQFPHGTIVALVTWGVAALELAARFQAQKAETSSG